MSWMLNKFSFLSPWLSLLWRPLSLLQLPCQLLSSYPSPWKGSKTWNWYAKCKVHREKQKSTPDMLGIRLVDAVAPHLILPHCILTFICFRTSTLSFLKWMFYFLMLFLMCNSLQTVEFGMFEKVSLTIILTSHFASCFHWLQFRSYTSSCKHSFH